MELAAEKTIFLLGVGQYQKRVNIGLVHLNLLWLCQKQKIKTSQLDEAPLKLATVPAQVLVCMTDAACHLSSEWD